MPHIQQSDQSSPESENAAAERFLTAPQVQERYGVSDMWLHRRLHDSDFPPPAMVIGRRRFWKLTELVAWERACAREVGSARRGA
jgi:predicted DNA-binding transcriptional regulator AlpA